MRLIGVLTTLMLVGSPFLTAQAQSQNGLFNPGYPGWGGLLQRAEPQQADEAWGGNNITVVVKGETAEIQLDCAKGIVEKGWAFNNGVLKADGRFIHIYGPSRIGTLSVPPGKRYGMSATFHPAHFEATVQGNKMNLKIYNSAVNGEFTLYRGRWPHRPNCR